MYVIFALRLPLKRDKIHMVSQMAHAKNLGEPFMAHLENLYNILWLNPGTPENRNTYKKNIVCDLFVTIYI